MKTRKHSLLVPALAAAMLAGVASADPQAPTTAKPAPVAGVATATVGVTIDEAVIVARGWSVKKQLLGKPVYNDKNERIGKLEDIIVNPERALSYGIIGAGGFLGMAMHDVAIPTNQFKIENDKITLPGATKDVIKAMPEFHYAPRS
jgi:sporulation protein YlmC with PRC-barrel domain